MKKISLVLLFLIFTSTTELFTQTVQSLNFFPHHKGDVFEYEQLEHLPYSQNIINKDSLSADGKYYLEISNNVLFSFGHRYLSNKLCVDTVNYEVRSRVGAGNIYSYLWFKLDADSGDNWIVINDSSGTIRAEVTSLFETEYLGENVKVKVIEYRDTAANGFTNSVFWLTNKFGVIKKEEGFPLWFTWNLRGAEINGKIYGEITSANKNSETNPKGYYLSFNYPNPFNPETTISYKLQAPCYTTLKVYDVLGREVVTLVNEFQNAGSYKVVFNGQLPTDNIQLTSGVYFYRLQADDFVQTKKLMFLK
jgi:hypothetical protein